MSLIRASGLLAGAVLALSASISLADGGYFAAVAGSANSADQRALIIDHGEAETIVLHTDYAGDFGDFAWVVPVPELIGAGAIGTASGDVFAALDDLTTPRGFVSTGGGCYGCGGGAEGTNRLDVTVWETLRVDGYEVAVLSAEQSADLASWLDDNGYALPAGAQEHLEYYVDREWFFVALKIDPARPGAGGGGGGGGGGAAEELRPIMLTFPTDGSDRLVYPLRISQVSTPQRVEVLAYVLAPHRVESTNYPTVEVQVPRSYGEDDFDAAYDGWFEDTIAGAGGAALVVEYAGPLPGWIAGGPAFEALLDEGEQYFLTRLRARLEPADMDEDVLMAAAATDAPFEVQVAAALPFWRGRVGFAILLLAGLQALAAKSPSGRRLAWTGGVLGLLVLLL